MISKIPEERLKQLREIREEFLRIRDLYADFVDWFSTQDIPGKLFFDLPNSFFAFAHDETLLKAIVINSLDILKIDMEGNVYLVKEGGSILKGD